LLFVEDVEADVELVKAILMRAGLRVEIEAVANEAELRRAVREPWDIVLSDFNLPAFDAFGVLKVLRDEAIDAPCILVSGTVGEEIATQAMRAGARDYVLKTNLARLPAVVRREIAEAQQRSRRKRLERTHNALRDVAFEAGRFLDPGVLGRYVLDKSRELLSVDAASLYWWSDRHTGLELLSASGSSSEAPSGSTSEALGAVGLGAAASGLAFQRREPVIIHDYRVWPERTVETSGSAVAVPALAGYRALGALYVHSFGLRKFGDEDVHALQLLASQVAPAIMVRQLLSALQASEQRYETVFRRNPVGSIVTRASDHVVLDVNESLLELIGYRRDQVLGQSARALGLMANDQEEQLAEARQVGRAHQGTEVQLRNREGELREVVVYAESIVLDGSPALLSSVVDVTTRRSPAGR
jgi:PAS domain S-box-containing protein